MIIPITIGYKDDKKVIKDLAELGHLLVHLYEDQMDFIRNSKDFIYEKIKSDNYDVFPIYFDLKDQTNMARMYHKIEENYKITKDRLDMFNKEKCKSINEYNDTHNDNLKHIVLLIYEMAKNELAFDCGILGKTCYLTFKKEDYIDID